MDKILITGSKGFIGKHLSTFYSDKVALLSPGRKELELTDSEAVSAYFKANNPNVIINAASTGVSRSDTRTAMDCFHENMKSFANLSLERASLKKFIQIGSGAEYGRPLVNSKIKESQFADRVPSDEYGLAKYLSSKLLCRSRFEAVTLRFFGVYGPYEDVTTRFISYAIMQAINRSPILIKQDVVFDYLYVGDAVRIIDQFVERDFPFSDCNVASGVSIKLSAIAEIVRSVLKAPVDIKIEKPGLNHEYTCNIDRLVDFLPNDFTFTSIKDGVRRLFSWYEQQLNKV